MLQKTLVITNKLGLHARAAAQLVKHASRYISKIHITAKNKTVPAKSIMGVMLLAASKGTEITFTINGPDEQQAMRNLENLITNKFGEESNTPPIRTVAN